MVFIFLYGPMNNVDKIKKLDKMSEHYGGYVPIKKYDKENDILEISENDAHNLAPLYGKIVKFTMNIFEVVEKLKEPEDCYKNKNKNTLNTVWATDVSGKNVRRVYILY